MPKELTHWLLAEHALRGLPPESRLACVIHEHYKTFLAGAVLPDTLLHLFRGPFAHQALTLANNFHNAAGNSFEPLLNAEAQLSWNMGPQLFSCLLGVICHMQADIVFHPFVYAAAGVTGTARHYMIETALDGHFLRKGKKPPVFLMEELVSADNMQTLVQTCGLLFDPDRTLPEQILAEAINLHCRFQSLYSKTSWHLLAKLLAVCRVGKLQEQQHLFYPLPFSPPLDLSPYEAEWCHPASGKPVDMTLEQMADAATSRIVAIFKRIDDVGCLGDVLRDLPGENLLSGLYGITFEDMTARDHKPESDRWPTVGCVP